MFKNSALYARVSTNNQSVDDQVEKLESWAESNSDDYQTFKDEGVSAVADERPGFEYMMETIDDFDSVAITELDRLGRSLDQLTTWTSRLEDMGIDLVIVDRNIDTSTREGELLFNMMMVIADYERKLIRERLEAGYRQAVEEGKVGRPRADVDIDEVINLWNNGASASFIANQFDVSRNVIYDRLHEHEDRLERSFG